jgi:glutamine amidotransferase
MIGVLDYGVGNINAFISIYKKLGIKCQCIDTPQKLRDSTKIILPGVGHFDHAMKSLNESGLRFTLEKMVFDFKTPILGICVGMHMLSSYSDEGNLEGLNWIPGSVNAFSSTISNKYPVPHMGWNNIKIKKYNKIIDSSINLKQEYYFLHSYYFEAADHNDSIATSNYGIEFDAVVSKGHIYGIQCHPEKSHHWGITFLKNFAYL